MNELSNVLKEEFSDKEVRHIYCDEFLNTSIATQIKVLREQRGLTQSKLAKLAGMRQSRISALEDVSYSSWSIKTLRKLAEAFDLALTVKFDSFGEKLGDIEIFDRKTLEKPSFEDDPAFEDQIIEDSISSTEGTVTVLVQPEIQGTADSFSVPKLVITTSLGAQAYSTILDEVA